MFSKDKSSKAAVEISKEQNKIAAGTSIKGDIEAKGALRIDGSIEGNVKTPGKVVIGKEGSINGDLECENADIEGKFTGNLRVNGTLSLRSSAVIEGDVTASKLAVEPGAALNASCSMNGGLKSLKNERGEGRKQTEKSA